MLRAIAIYMGIYCFIVIPLHELGHVLMYWGYTRKFPKNITLSLRGIEVTLDNILEEKETAILITGIIAGAVPLFFLPYYMGWVMALPYFLIGCGYDIGRLGQIAKKLNTEELKNDA